MVRPVHWFLLPLPIFILKGKKEAGLPSIIWWWKEKNFSWWSIRHTEKCRLGGGRWNWKVNRGSGYGGIWRNSQRTDCFLSAPTRNTGKRGKPVWENWQKAYENGEYLRSAEITEEQNYNMIDGRMNNLPVKPRKIGTRISVLDRLHLKQAALNMKNLPQPVMENEMERKRK